MRSAKQQRDLLAVAEHAVLVQDQARMFRSQQALTDHYQNKLLGVPLPEDEMIHIGDVTLPPEKPQQPASRLSPLAAVALGLLTASVPAAGAIGYLLKQAPAIEKTIEKVVTKPGQDYDVNVEMEVIPPP